MTSTLWTGAQKLTRIDICGLDITLYCPTALPLSATHSGPLKAVVANNLTEVWTSPQYLERFEEKWRFCLEIGDKTIV